MNNIAAAAVLLPAVTAAGRRARVSPARLLMPLAFSTLLGGMATLLTTANIVSAACSRTTASRASACSTSSRSACPGGLRHGLRGAAGPAVAARAGAPGLAPGLRPAGDLVEIYRLGERLFRARVPAGSYLIGRPVADSMPARDLQDQPGGGRARRPADPVAAARPGARRGATSLNFQGDLEDFRRRDVEPYLDILPERSWRETDLESRDTVVVEAILAAARQPGRQDPARGPLPAPLRHDRAGHLARRPADRDRARRPAAGVRRRAPAAGAARPARPAARRAGPDRAARARRTWRPGARASTGRRSRSWSRRWPWRWRRRCRSAR